MKEHVNQGDTVAQECVFFVILLMFFLQQLSSVAPRMRYHTLNKSWYHNYKYSSTGSRESKSLVCLFLLYTQAHTHKQTKQPSGPQLSQQGSEVNWKWTGSGPWRTVLVSDRSNWSRRRCPLWSALPFIQHTYVPKPFPLSLLHITQMHTNTFKCTCDCCPVHRYTHAHVP